MVGKWMGGWMDGWLVGWVVGEIDGLADACRPAGDRGSVLCGSHFVP